MPKIKREDWTLLVLAAAEGKSLSPVQLQKILFLFGQKMPKVTKANYYQFRPYAYGPFDSSIYADADELAESGYVSVQEKDAKKWSTYRATREGLKRAEKVRGELSSDASDYLDSLVEWARSLSFRDLLRAVYAKYPDYAVNSVFRG